VARRSAHTNDASEADLTVLQRQVAAQEPLTAEEQAGALTIDTDAPQALEHLLQTVQAMGVAH
jgi:predicted kinase